MAEKTKIQWCDATFNPWIGCTKVSAGCAACYAETLDKNRFSKTLGEGTSKAPVSHWGKGAPRHRTSVSYWQEPLKWNRAATQNGTRPRVFCASLADVFDPEVADEWRDELFALVALTPQLDWLFLTKRPAEAARYLAVSLDGSYPEIDRMERGLRIASHLSDPAARDRVANEFLMDGTFENVWLGTSVENQKAAEERVPILLQIPATVRFLSMEPLLESVWLYGLQCSDVFNGGGRPYYNAFGGYSWRPNEDKSKVPRGPKLDWLIIGGESGQGARGFNLEWARDLIFQSKYQKTAVFVKQLGTAPYLELVGRTPRKRVPVALRDKKGGDWDEWPEDLRLREFPEVAK